MRRGLGVWLMRALVVVGLAALILLGGLVLPLSAPTFPTLTPTLTLTPRPTATDTSTPLPTATFTPRPTATSTPTPTPTPTSTPTPRPSPTPTVMPASPTAETASAETSVVSATFELTGLVEQQVYTSQVTGQQEAYHIYLPPGYDQGEQRYAVLYLLHGWPLEAADWEQAGIYEAVDAGIQAGTLPPFIIVLPQGRERIYINTAGGDHSFEGQLLTDLIPHIDGAYRTRAERAGRAVGGISRGGVWALEISFRHPDLFTVVGAHSPALSANRAPPVYDPFNLMKEPGVETLRIYLSAGDRDWAWKSTKALHEALTKQGIASSFEVHEGVHRYALWSEHLSEYLTFYTAAW